MVITTSAACTASSVSGLGNSWDRSRPSSSIAATTAGLMVSAGADPAERTVTRPAAWWSSRAAAICERPALWTHTNSTSGRSDTRTPWFLGGEESASPQGRVDQGDQHGHLDQRADHAGEGLSAGGAE